MGSTGAEINKWRLKIYIRRDIPGRGPSPGGDSLDMILIFRFFFSWEKKRTLGMGHAKPHRMKGFVIISPPKSDIDVPGLGNGIGKGAGFFREFVKC